MLLAEFAVLGLVDEGRIRFVCAFLTIHARVIIITDAWAYDYIHIFCTWVTGTKYLFVYQVRLGIFLTSLLFR